MVDPRPPDPRHDSEPLEGTYERPPADDRPRPRGWRNAGGAAVGLAVVAAKFKSLLLVLLNLKYLLFGAKYLISAGSFLVSIWFYTLFFGLKFAIVFVLLIAVHELGHVIFVRGFGLSAPFVYFVPGMGAFTTWRGAPQSIYQESLIAFGGPLLGTLGGLACFGYGYFTNEPFWYACANTAFFLNLFNMIPVGIFDGGRMTGAISPRLWIFGFVAVVVAAIAFHWWSPILIIIVALSLPRAIAAWRGKLDPRYFDVLPAQRASIAFAYFGLLAVLLACLVFSQVSIPGHTTFA